MKVKVLKETIITNINSGSIKNFKAYVQGAIDYRQEVLGESKTRIILRYKGTGSDLGVLGMLVFDPKRKQDWIDKDGKLDCNQSDTLITKNNGFETNNADQKMQIIRLTYFPQKYETKVIYDEVGDITVVFPDGRQGMYTFSIENYG